jgi:hypothetical protein
MAASSEAVPPPAISMISPTHGSRRSAAGPFLEMGRGLRGSRDAETRTASTPGQLVGQRAASPRNRSCRPARIMRGSGDAALVEQVHLDPARASSAPMSCRSEAEHEVGFSAAIR